jgi:hypothetical protein
METIEEIIAMFGGVDGLYVAIANEPFMRLVIEHIGEGPHGVPAISVAHYYEMNGDLCQDPEMCFEIESTQHGTVMHPYMFQMANRGISLSGLPEISVTPDRPPIRSRNITSLAGCWRVMRNGARS